MTVKQVFSILKIFVKNFKPQQVLLKWQESDDGTRSVTIEERGTEIRVTIIE